MPVQNKAMLITYSDSMGKNIKELQEILGKYIGDAIGGVHLLPFFPSTGDRGFAPSDYTRVKLSLLALILCLTALPFLSK